MEIALQYTESYNETILSFVNNVKTIDGGSHEIGFKTGITKISTLIPEELTLMQNYPNPFNPATKIRFAVPVKLSGVIIMLRIYDLTGKEVANPVNVSMNAGYYETDFNASNLASGVYVYRLQAGNFTEQKKFTLIK